MLKVFAVKSLLPGMLVGRTVYDGDSDDIIVEGGTVLEVDDIQRLREKNIISVYVDEDSIVEVLKSEQEKQDYNAAEEELIKGRPVKDAKIDDVYQSNYYKVYLKMENLLNNAVRTRRLDEESLHDVMESGALQELYREAAKAVNVLYSMNQQGDYNVHHCIRVAIFAGLMSRWLQMSGRERQNLVLAGLLADVGKQNIDKSLLNKKGRLTPSEFNIVKKHVDHSLDLVMNSSLAKKKELIDGIRHHHERSDGSGYPDGIKGDNISRFGKILAVLDSYDAMASRRAHASKKSPFDVLRIIYDEVVSGRLDSEYAVLFIRNLYSSLNGAWLKLSDGRIGRIIYIDESRLNALPIIQLSSGEVLDLNTAKNVEILEIMTAADVQEAEG